MLPSFASKGRGVFSVTCVVAGVQPFMWVWSLVR